MYSDVYYLYKKKWRVKNLGKPNGEKKKRQTRGDGEGLYMKSTVIMEAKLFYKNMRNKQ